jgi:protein involved in polysaccharide export with SLBB domain
MKLVKLLTLLFCVVLLASGNGWAADKVGRPETGSPIPAGEQPREPSNQKRAQSESGGAAPEPSLAEKLRDAEAVYQAQLTDISKAVIGLERRVLEMRRAANPPGRFDIERIDRDLELTEAELNKITVASLSPLTQLQRTDLQDRLFEIRLSMEILKNRWVSSWKVFGIDYFSNAFVVTGSEQAPAPARYRVRTGDTLRVEVSSNLGAQHDYHPVVDSSGRIHVPGAGSVFAVGKTVLELQQTLSSRIRSRFKQLKVSVSVDRLSTIRVQVSGEVARPGTYVMTGMATVFSALYQAGGPTKSGTFRRLSLVREGRPPRRVDLYGFLLKGSKDDDVPLEDGDLVFVPPVGGTIVVDGEVVRPGRYEPDFPISLADALKMAGGAKPGGYLQTVQVERVENGQYKVLLSTPLKDGDGKAAFVLEPGDQVTVSAVRTDRTNQVEISGPVGAPGIYGFTDGMRVADLVRLAQGLDSKTEVYTGRADILRTNPLGSPEILTFDLQRALSGDHDQNLELRKLDRVFIYEPDQVVFRPKLVTVLGAVAKPGIYRRTDGMCVSDVIAAAGGVLPSAYLDRADMIRYSSDDSPELARINLRSALSRDVSANLKLKDRDEITVYTIDEAAWRDSTVRIEGTVQRPGVYARSKNMRVSDLLFACGGLLPESAKIAEVARCGESGQSSIVKVNLDGLVQGTEADIELRDRDVVTVPSLNPSIRSPEIVYLGGEVQKPGPYALNGRDDKLIDVIERAGGLTQYADVRGMLFLRQKESFENAQQGKDVDIILERSRAFADKQFLTHLAKLGVGLPGQFIQAIQQSAEQLAKPAAVVEEEKLEKTSEVSNEKPAKTPPDYSKLLSNGEKDLKRSTEPDVEATREMSKASAMGPRVAELDRSELSGFEGRRELALLANSARVSVNLSKAFDDPSSPDNITMREGDRVFIPRITNVVKVIGAVLHPHSFAAGPGKSVDYYIQRSGGFAQDAAKGSVVVVRSNGDALPKGEVRSVEPGDTIVVPTTGLIDIAKKWERVGSVTKVISDILGSVFILTRF